ncbi:hypothetical protein ABFT80_14045 [Mesorhizobium sp. SB112]|uniref:hypothetical protein n=1 Tax=Mesorhizobium sp. SB112 TaxID=3151853 RepID=UPI00326688A7
MPLQKAKLEHPDISDAELIQLLFNQVTSEREGGDEKRKQAEALIDLFGGTSATRAHLIGVLETNCTRQADALSHTSSRLG